MNIPRRQLLNFTAGSEHRRFTVRHSVHPSVPAQTVPELIAHAKANPGKINVAMTDLGGVTRMAAELFKMMADVDLVIVPHAARRLH